MAFGEHLGADDQLWLAALDGGQMRFEAAFASNTIPIESGDQNAG